MEYDQLLSKAESVGVEVYEKKMSPAIKGLYGDGVIWINRLIPTLVEKICILGEELGHHQTSSGDIIDQKNFHNRKQELRARRWSYNELVPLNAIVEASLSGVKERHELAEFLDVTEDFLQSSIDRYRDKHGLFIIINERYSICFEPLLVFELF